MEITTKLTNKEALEQVLEMAETANNANLVRWAHERIEALDKRASKRVAAADKPENVALAAKVCDVLAEARVEMTTSQIGSKLGLSTSKTTSLLQTLVADGRVARSIANGKTPYFKVLD